MMKTGALMTRTDPHAIDVRAVRNENDQLRKELGRKDARNDNLSKELVALRTTNANQLRDLRIMSSTYVI